MAPLVQSLPPPHCPPVPPPLSPQAGQQPQQCSGCPGCWHSSRGVAVAVPVVPPCPRQGLCERGNRRREGEGASSHTDGAFMVPAFISDPKNTSHLLHPGLWAHLPWARQSWARGFCAQVQRDGRKCRGSEGHPHLVAVSRAPGHGCIHGPWVQNLAVRGLWWQWVPRLWYQSMLWSGQS